MDEINEGLHILLERLKSNPEDFEGIGDPSSWSNNKWSKLIQEVQNAQWFSQEEKKQLDQALTHMRRTNYTRKVLIALTDDRQDPRLHKSSFGMVP